MGVILALISSIAWGSADFDGGVISKKISAPLVVLYSQVFAMVGIVTVGVVTSDIHLGVYMWWAVLAGVAGPTALVSYYRALSIGPMGVVGPISATAGLVPILSGLLLGESLSQLRIVGLIGAVVGVIALSAQHLVKFSRGDLRVILLSLCSAVGFGVVLVSLNMAAPHGVVSALAVQRVTTVLLLGGVLLGKRVPLGVSSDFKLRSLIFVGALDISSNALFSLAGQFGQLAIVGALGSLYPLTTVVLSGVILKERLTKIQILGAVITLSSVAIAAAA